MKSCKVCGGTSRAINPAWREYNCAVIEGQIKNTREDLLKFFNDRGYTRPPLVRIPCEACGGKGYVLDNPPKEGGPCFLNS